MTRSAPAAALVLAAAPLAGPAAAHEAGFAHGHPHGLELLLAAAAVLLGLWLFRRARR